MILDGTKLRKLRDKRRISQFELADAVELSQSCIAKYERSNSSIKFNTLLLLCNYFCVEPKELLITSSTPPRQILHQSLGMN
jgi:transcriptional regulator with XRE-family HTH domain